MNPGLRKLVQKFAELVAEFRALPKIKFGTVATVAPLTVYLDGDFDEAETPIATPATSMAGALTVGQLVSVVEQNRRVTVIAGGETPGG